VNGTAASNGEGLRVAFVVYQRRWTGAALSMLGLLDGLPAHGVLPHVVIQRGSPITSAISARQVPLAQFPLRRWMEPRVSALWPVQALGRMGSNLVGLPGVLRQLRAWDVDVIVTNTSAVPVGAFAAALLHTPHVWIVREFGLVDSGSRHDFGRRVFDFWLRRATRVIAVSEAVRLAVLDGLPPERVDVIHNGVAFAPDFATLLQRARAERRDPDRFTFLVAGRIQPQKGQETAIRALARLAPEFPEVRLEIVGDGETRNVERCRALVEKLALRERVTFRGHVADPWPYFVRADAVLMCSVSEAMGRVTAEAMATGRPVIGHATGGTSELIRDGQTGLLYSGDDEALAASMRRVLERPEWRRQLGEQAWRDARERFTIERYAGSVAHSLRQALAGRNGQRRQ
jgi:glycosyltransferase involved in cell wall biosynthesis